MPVLLRENWRRSRRSILFFLSLSFDMNVFLRQNGLKEINDHIHTGWIPRPSWFNWMTKSIYLKYEDGKVSVYYFLNNL